MLLAIAAVVAVLLALPARGMASSGLQSILQDDQLILYSSPQKEVQTLETLHALGVDVVKASMVWWLVAPDANNTTRPNFNATNPAAYGTLAWGRYDLLVETAHRLGMKVFFQFAPPDPAWARDKHFAKQGESLGHAPKAHDFQQFVQAVGKRYSGTYRDANGKVIPRVSWWAIWNEPNFPAWLNPWRQKVHGHSELTQPLIYRSIVNAAWAGLSASGHGHDTILIGETANVGNVNPIPFVEDLYCVGNSFHRLTGNAARAVGCPESGKPSSFVAQNPGLFHIAGWAHHPYVYDQPPNKPSSFSSQVTMANLSWLEHVLDHTFSAYSRSRHGGIPLYLTEWGYVTHPPNENYTTTLQQQATWLNEGEYMAWKLPYVKALAQFKLLDGNPVSGVPLNKQWALYFASGLIFQDGKPKPSLRAYRLPIWLPVEKHGSHVTVWGQLRPASHSGLQVGQLQFKAHGSTWKKISTVRTRSSEGFFQVHVSIPSAGKVRLVWVSPTGTTDHSRYVSVS